MSNEVLFENYIKYWYDDIEKKLYRCAKELGFYKKLKKVLSINALNDSRDLILYSFYNKIVKKSVDYENCLIHFDDDFCSSSVKRVYSTNLVLSDKRYFSQIMVYSILKRVTTYDKLMDDAFLMMDELIFGKRKVRSFIIEKMSILKVILK